MEKIRQKIRQNRSLIIAVFICYYSLFQSNTVFASRSINDFKIPANLGNIKEIFEAPRISQNSDRIIVHIQDAHCNYEAQKNMSQILEQLITGKNLKLIMVEGGSGDVNLSFLRSYADKQARQEVAEKYLKEGKISGEEYLDIISDYQLELYGIEDQALYDAHLNSFLKIDAIKEEGLKYLSDISLIVKELKSRLYNAGLKGLEAKKSDYGNKTISLLEYCQYLGDVAAEKGLQLNADPNFLAFLDSAQSEKTLDNKATESERDRLIKNLAAVLNERDIQRLIQKGGEFKSGQITAQEFYSLLESLSRYNFNLSRDYPNLSTYIKYLNKSKNLDVKELLTELNSIEEDLKIACITTPSQKKLSEVSRSLEILTSILTLELVPEDYAYFKANKSKFLTSTWVEFLNEKCAKFNLTLRPSASGIIDENISKLSEFYKLGFEREHAFIKNIVNKMDESGEKIAVFIAGGFHTPGLTRMFKEQGYSYIVVTPAITQKTDSSVYLSVLRGERKTAQER